MKKKILSFVLMICLLFPFTFTLTGCFGSSDGIDLAGKTIIITDGFVHSDTISYSNWYAHPTEFDYVDGMPVNKWYVLEWSTDKFVDELWDTRVFKTLFDDESLNTKEKAQTALYNYVLEEMIKQYPTFKFSDDATTVTTYASSDTDLTNPLKTYYVKLEENYSRRTYSLYENANFDEDSYYAKIDCTNIIQFFPDGGFYSVEIDLSEFNDIMVTLTMNDGRTTERPLSEGYMAGDGSYKYKIA